MVPTGSTVEALVCSLVLPVQAVVSTCILILYVVVFFGVIALYIGHGRRASSPHASVTFCPAY